LLVKWWARLTPPASESEFDRLDFEALRARNGLAPATFWLLALGFGLMVLLPVAYVAAVTLPHGAQRFREYWRFYELKWGIGLSGIRWVYIPIAILGLVSFVMVVRTVGQ
jgi:hypothetical protein